MDGYQLIKSIREFELKNNKPKKQSLIAILSADDSKDNETT